MRTRLTVVLAVVVGLLVPVGVAEAVYDPDGVPQRNDGGGELRARGRGQVDVTGSGLVKIRLRGDAEIAVGAGTAIALWPFGTAPARRLEGGTTIALEDFSGILVVRGPDFSISARGRFRSITARGEGVARLGGRGWYRASGGSFGTWTRPGVTVAYGL